MRYKDKDIVLKDGTKCLLRSPDEQDAAAMLQYMKMTSTETHYMVRYPEEIQLTEAKEAEFLKNCLESEQDIMIAAFVDGELAGNAGLNCANNFMKIRHRAVLGISIKEKYWNKGIGSTLIQEAIKMAEVIGYEQIELGVFDDNTKAQKLYHRFGFNEWGKVKNAFKLKDGTYCNEMIMGKILRSN
ncbi:GNAT family N-acetyltransferase [Irregularibacter muris]|uniref:GNAT family N-acetyltransferase n=1 Tax=Irregularibacter muris TaxID=1796619 RepID=A0AAE3L316_9FIRM|nr:GNAT family N-acetyltransferase [Irregularibacter muris]MCR1897468.1 GNAT family N-acetyltransferase [Irregularibacter muris]